MNEEKIKALFENEDFRQKIADCETAKEVSDIFAEEDIEITEEQVQTIHDFLQEHEGEELTEEQLEEVSGGFAVLLFLILTVVGAAAYGTHLGTKGRW